MTRPALNSPQTDERAPAMYAPEARSFFSRPSLGDAAGRETSVCVRRGAFSWRQYQTSRKSARGNLRDRIFPTRTKLSLANLEPLPSSYGQSKRPTNWRSSPRLTNEQQSAGYAASMSRLSRSSWQSSTKCCVSKRSLTSVKEAA